MVFNYNLWTRCCDHYYKKQLGASGMEPIEKIIEGIKLVAEGFAESVIKAVTSFANSIPKVISYELVILSKAKNSTDNRKRKAYVIYHRTNSKRIKNKQLKIMEG